ncbi:protocatechuate 3,4-dioxygenase beta subunit [Inquilinus ginsengisoli]|uniref:protocatechuate 3,4-dioxygenase subunit beta n=1 Tax=Inquilinus ginsengisoli TaxID=363840 RepID=UPI003D1DCCE9
MSFQPRDWRIHPPHLYEGYRSTVLRAPSQKLLPLSGALSEHQGPSFPAALAGEADLTRNGRVNGEPLGERIIVAGRVLDEDARPVANTLVELWQANASGRYIHKVDQHDAPLDPNFLGAGRCVTDAEGRYRFLTIKPGAYPWRNHANAWRPQHIHFSLFGPAFATRLVTQMYFPGDPLHTLDPMFNSIPDPAGRERLVAAFSLDLTEPEVALGYEFDIVLRGRLATPMEG